MNASQKELRKKYLETFLTLILHLLKRTSLVIFLLLFLLTLSSCRCLVNWIIITEVVRDLLALMQTLKVT